MPDDPRSHMVLSYESPTMDLFNPYLEAAFGIEPYS